jgi:TonB family protein
VSAAGSIEIIPDPYPSIRVPAESKGRLSRPGTSLQFGRLVSKIEPVYPQEALRQRVAGTVKVHVVIGENGTVERAELLDGPSLLAEAALRAVQQWRYEPTLLGSEAIEVEDDITVVFRITSPPLPAN